MIDLIVKELESYGIKLQSGSSCMYLGKPMHIEMCDRLLRSYIAENKKVAAQLWQDLMGVFKSESTVTGDNLSAYQQIFVNSVQSLYYLAAGFNKLHEMGVVRTLKGVLSKDIQSFSTLAMSKTLEYHLAIEWIDFLIRQDIYIRSLIRSYKMHARNNTVVASGTSGPWSNLDLPMNERVWEWQDQEEETEGRERDKQQQSRYTKGLENYGNGDYTNNADAGHYWRAINLEPYSFDDDSASLYPKREMLWV